MNIAIDLKLAIKGAYLALNTLNNKMLSRKQRYGALHSMAIYLGIICKYCDLEGFKNAKN